MTDNTVGLRSLGFHIPGCIPVEDLPEIRSLSPDQRSAFSALRAENVAVDNNLDDIGLAVAGSRQALDAGGLSAKEIDVLIYLQSRAPKYLLSSEAGEVQARLGAKRAFAFTVTDLGCANICGALQVGRRMLTADPKLQNVLICSGSKPVGTSRYREGVAVLGDAGMGVILSRAERHVIVDLRVVTDGRYWDLYRVDYRGKHPDEFHDACSNERFRFELSVATRNVFRQMNEEILRDNDVDRADLAGYIMPNLSFASFDFNEDILGIKFLDSCYQNCRRYSHFGGIDILLNYQTSLESDEIRTGDLVLVMNNSPTACWSSMLVQV